MSKGYDFRKKKLAETIVIKKIKIEHLPYNFISSNNDQSCGSTFYTE